MMSSKRVRRSLQSISTLSIAVADTEAVTRQTEAHKARSAELDQLRRELAEAQAAAAAARTAGVSLSLRSGSGANADGASQGSGQGSMPVTPTASWTQVRPCADEAPPRDAPHVCGMGQVLRPAAGHGSPGLRPGLIPCHCGETARDHDAANKAW